MKIRKLVKIFLIVLFVLLIIIVMWLSRYFNKAKYLNKVLGIEITDMIEDIEGIIRPGFIFSPELMQLKVKVKKGNENEFLYMLKPRSYNIGDIEESIKLLDYFYEGIRSKYLKEIKASDISFGFGTIVEEYFYGRPIYVYVTDQGGDMIVYFMDAHS